MTSLTSYLLVILIVLIILLTITYTTDYISLPLTLGCFSSGKDLPQMPKFFNRDDDSSSSDIEHEKKYKQSHKNQSKQLIQSNQSKQLNQSYPINQSYPVNQSNSNTDISNFLIETNESDNINNKLFSGYDEFQMTETTGNAIADALRNI